MNDDDLKTNPSVLNQYGFKVHTWRSDLDRLRDDLKDVVYAEQDCHIEPTSELVDKLNNDISDTLNDLAIFNAILDTLIEKTKIEQNPTTALLQAFREVANSPNVDLPTFDGPTTLYTGFKSNFQYVIEKVNGPKELRATHLMNSLRGAAKEYIGDNQNKWYNQYDKLWKVLDEKFGNKWVVNPETVVEFSELVKKYF